MRAMFVIFFCWIVIAKFTLAGLRTSSSFTLPIDVDYHAQVPSGIVQHVGFDGKHELIRGDIQDLYFMMNGYYSNFHEDKVEDDGKHVRIEILLKPVYLPQIQKDYVAYIEETINGNLYRRFVTTLNKMPNSRLIKVTTYNFTWPRTNKPGTFNTDDLVNLRRENIYTTDGCVVLLEQLPSGSFSGKGMDCKHVIAGQHPWYSFMLYCDSILIKPPNVSAETATSRPYILQLKSHRYPVRGLPKDFVRPCNESKDAGTHVAAHVDSFKDSPVRYKLNSVLKDHHSPCEACQ